jgi:hypothetical protein
LGPRAAVVVHPPYVLAGDVSTADLDRCYQQTILPTALALSTSYFDRAPDAPITILMFASADSYREHARRLDGRDASNYHGYFEQSKRRVMLNLATGDGTLAHELTHARAQFDFPDMPEWFDEGLASLHEESRFADGGRRLVGLSNWRLYYLMQALRGDTLPTLDELLAARDVRPAQQAIDYAYARYVCLYLQEHGLLEPFYRKFRATSATDPTGAMALCELLRVDSLSEADGPFRTWAYAQLPQHQADSR